MKPASLIRRTTARAVQRAVKIADGWASALTGLGFTQRDKTLNARFVPDILTDQEAEDIYRGDDMAARIIDRPVGEMLRQGFSLSLDLPGKTDEERSKIERAIMGKLGDLKVKGKYGRALRWERAYGGGGIFIGADDGGRPMREPLNLAAVRTVRWLNVLHKRELTPVEWYSDPKEPDFGEPSVYRINPRSVFGVNNAELNNAEVHASRLILFKGIEVSENQLANNNGWGDSNLVRCNRVLSRFDQSWSSAAILLADFAQAVIKIKGLAELLEANDCDAVVNRAIGVDFSRSAARAVIIDSEEEYERKATPITGMPEMLQQFALRLSAAAEMPVSLLLGQAPAGLAATGDADIRFFYDLIAEKQDDKLRPALEYLIKILLLSKDGPTGGVEPDSWEIVFNSLWQPSQPEQADIRLKTAQADDVWLSHGVISPDECAESRFGGGTFSTNTVIDLKLREKMKTLPAEAEGEPTPPTDPSVDPAETPPTTNVTVTPTAVESIVSVNEARIKAGYGPKLLPNGQPDPDGDLDVDVYRAKKASITAANAAAESGQTAPTKPTTTPPAGNATP